MFHGRARAITYGAYGDCCSETWFADITGLDNLRGQVVIGVRVLDVTLPEGDLRTRQEEDEVSTDTVCQPEREIATLFSVTVPTVITEVS